jgi:tRNA(Ile)-lysidine synthase TilS/MesJ
MQQTDWREKNFNIITSILNPNLFKVQNAHVPGIWVPALSGGEDSMTQHRTGNGRNE